jgi:putative membrane protein
MRGTILATLVLGILLAACAKDPRDQDFVTKAGQGGLAEVKMGQSAMEKGVAPDIRTFAQRMVADHSKANEELKSVATRAGAAVPAEPSSDQQKWLADMSEKSGDDFDKAYAKMMVKDHEDTIDLFKKEASSGENADLKAFAQKTLPTLEEHLKLAQALKANQ